MTLFTLQRTGRHIFTFRVANGFSPADPDAISQTVSTKNGFPFLVFCYTRGTDELASILRDSGRKNFRRTHVYSLAQHSATLKILTPFRTVLAIHHCQNSTSMKYSDQPLAILVQPLLSVTISRKYLVRCSRTKTFSTRYVIKCF